MFETLIQGLLLGGLYSLFALGLSLMFGVMRLTNTAQGDFIVLGAFAAIAALSVAAVSPLLVALVVLALPMAGHSPGARHCSVSLSDPHLHACCAPLPAAGCGVPSTWPPCIPSTMAPAG